MSQIPKLGNVLCCQKCHGKIKFSVSETCDLGFKINVTCSNCKQLAVIKSSKLVDPAIGTCKVNSNSVLAAHKIGYKQIGLSAFCDSIIDLSESRDPSGFDLINHEQVTVKKEVDEVSSNDAELDAPVHGIVKEEIDETLALNAYPDTFMFVTVKEELDETFSPNGEPCTFMTVTEELDETLSLNREIDTFTHVTVKKESDETIWLKLN